MLNREQLATITVLLVDDEPDNLEVICESLEFYGLTCIRASDGIEGLEILKTQTVDLVLLDLSMPKMDGWAMRKALHENAETTKIPVVAISAHAMAGDKTRAMAAGFDGYLTKPINVPTLLDDLYAAMHDKGEANMTDWRVLVVEDEADSMELVQGILEYHGIKTVGATTGSEANTILQRHEHFDLLIIDLSLPDIDGWSLLEKIKRDDAINKTPRVAVTAYHNPMLAQKAIEAGFHAYFAKPIDATSFVRELQGIVGAPVLP